MHKDKPVRIMSRLFLISVLGLLGCCVLNLFAQTQDQQPGSESTSSIEPPKVFLDKSPRIVWFQLDRLDNERLLLVERKTDDAKYAPVYLAILTRAGMARQDRDEALVGLVAINKTDAATELLSAWDRLAADNRQDQRTSTQLAAMLVSLPMRELAAKKTALEAAAKSENALLRPVGYAGLIVSGEAILAGYLSAESQQATLDVLASVPLIPLSPKRALMWEPTLEFLEERHPEAVRRAAIEALAHLPYFPKETFQRLTPFVSEKSFRDAAVKTLLTIPPKDRPQDAASSLAKVLIEHAETTPAAERTTAEFLNAMQLADETLAVLPAETTKSYRERLRAVTVRVVQIRTIEEEMRYDTPYFAVEAGRPVQVVLKNDDLMPHNLVITQAGALQEIAEAGAVLGPSPGFEGKPYVPNSEKVLHSTGMVQVGQLERLTFTAPKEPGEYPYVCTFPRHWMRMYGVMVVVEDLDAWLKNPTKPKDPIGSNREFVKAWTMDDFPGDLGASLKGRSPEIGARLFKEATCAQCHPIKGDGGKVGPELSDVFKRWKGDRQGILREILDPSHRIEPKYAVQVIVTTDGLPLTGIVTQEDKDSISLLINPEAKPTIIPRSDIDEMVKASKSMMPKALLDRFTKEEVLEILAYLEGMSK